MKNITNCTHCTIFNDGSRLKASEIAALIRNISILQICTSYKVSGRSICLAYSTGHFKYVCILFLNKGKFLS